MTKPLLFAHFGLLAASAPAAASSLRCDGRLVTVGDSEYELRRKCGEPAHVAAQPREVSVGRLPAEGPGALATTREVVETWTYLPKDGQLGRLVTVRRGKVVAIRSLAAMHLDPDPGCQRGIVRRGATRGEVELSCGVPEDRSSWEEDYLVRGPRGVTVRRVRTRERWVYDPGPGRLLRVLEFVNGRLARISTGGRSP